MLRAAWFVLLPGLAAAAPKPTIVWQDRVIEAPSSTPAGATSVSHKLYLNDCRPNGCTVSPGNDDSLSNRSSIPQSTVTLDPYGHGDAHWDELVACVRDTFKPFDIEIVTEDPGNTPHFEVMIGGTSQQLRPGLDAGGVAPYISCGAARNNGLSFVFAGGASSINFLCGAVAQEACHVWGLDHELDPKDPMTYLDLGTSKRFQNSDPDCGESEPRRCRCGGNTQNSFRYMSQTFGLSPSLVDPTMTIDRPRDGDWVRPSFPISATWTSELSLLEGGLSIDGAAVEAAPTSGIFAFNAPALPAGSHAITVSATDAADRTATSTVTVNVIAACTGGAACASGTSCLGGFCVPGADVAGGLGADCTTNDDCVTGTCSSDGDSSLCTGACDAGACPSGFECLDGANVCWPSTAGGGCATSGSDGAGLLLFGLGAFAFSRRRRH